MDEINNNNQYTFCPNDYQQLNDIDFQNEPTFLTISAASLNERLQQLPQPDAEINQWIDWPKESNQPLLLRFPAENEEPMSSELHHRATQWITAYNQLKEAIIQSQTLIDFMATAFKNQQPLELVVGTAVYPVEIQLNEGQYQISLNSDVDFDMNDSLHFQYRQVEQPATEMVQLALELSQLPEAEYAIAQIYFAGGQQEIDQLEQPFEQMKRRQQLREEMDALSLNRQFTRSEPWSEELLNSMAVLEEELQAGKNNPFFNRLFKRGSTKARKVLHVDGKAITALPELRYFMLENEYDQLKGLADLAVNEQRLHEIKYDAQSLRQNWSSYRAANHLAEIDSLNELAERFAQFNEEPQEVAEENWISFGDYQTGQFKGEKPAQLKIGEKVYPVKNWRQLITTVWEYLYRRDEDNFRQLITIKPYSNHFNRETIRQPYQLAEDIIFDTNSSTDTKAHLIQQLQLDGYLKDSVCVQLAKKQ